MNNIKKIDGQLVLAENINTDAQELNKLSSHLIELMGDLSYRHNSIALRNSSIARILYYYDIYSKILDTPGVVCEFGVQYGATLSLLLNLRSILEPYNRSRIIYGFDTFSGFPDVDIKDGKHTSIGDYSTPLNYDEKLSRLLELQESFAPMNSIKKYQLIKGDATKTIDDWLEDNPHAIISLAIFDMDIYKPTKIVLQKIIPRLVRGSILVFDELNCNVFPGETRAVDEVLGLNNLKLYRSKYQPYGAWAVFGE